MIYRLDVGLDVDGVIANFGKRIMEVGHLMGLFKSLHRWYDQNTWFPASQDEYMQVWKVIEHDEGFWMSLEPFYDDTRFTFAPRAYITSRPVPSWVTFNWLNFRGFPVGAKTDIVTVAHAMSKLDPIRERNIEVFVEDRPDAFEQLREAGINCYLMDRPWNRSVYTEFRIYSVSEI